MKRKARGQRGSWFATVDGERLPCVHQFWMSGSPPKYKDPGAGNDGPWPEYIQQIKALKKVIVTTDDVPEQPTEGGWKRTGYVALWSIDNVALTGSDLCFDFVQRLEELR
jgi:hypothetical protein